MQNTHKQAQAANGFRIDTSIKVKTTLQSVQDYAEKNDMDHLPYNLVKACYKADRDAGKL